MHYLVGRAYTIFIEVKLFINRIISSNIIIQILR